MATRKKTIAAKKSAAKKSAVKKPAAKTSAARKPAAKKTTVKPKKAAAAKKTTAKVSPLKGSSVDDWAKKLTSWQADALEIIRALVTRHAPDATLAMKWGQPVWEKNGPFAWLRPAATHVSFGFWRGSEMNDPGGHLEGDGTSMRHLKVTHADELAELPIEAFVKQAVALNGSKGDPTKRS